MLGLLTLPLCNRESFGISRRVLRVNKDKNRNKPNQHRGNITQARLMFAKLGHLPTHRWQVTTKRLYNVTSSQLPKLYKVRLSLVDEISIF